MRKPTMPNLALSLSPSLSLNVCGGLFLSSYLLRLSGDGHFLWWSLLAYDLGTASGGPLTASGCTEGRLSSCIVSVLSFSVLVLHVKKWLVLVFPRWRQIKRFSLAYTQFDFLAIINYYDVIISSLPVYGTVSYVGVAWTREDGGSQCSATACTALATGYRGRKGRARSKVGESRWAVNNWACVSMSA